MNEFTWNDRKARDAAKEARVEGSIKAAERILKISQGEVPIDQGELRDSGRVVADEDGAIIAYDTPYAVRQHEDLTLRHPHGGDAKYLERPLSENHELLVRALAEALDQALR